MRGRMETGSDFENITHLVGFENVVPISLHTEEYKPFEGKSLAEIADTLGKEGKVSLQHVATAAKAEEEKPKTAYRSLHPKHHEKLVKKMEMVGIENMTPCEQCKIATECQNCCRVCEPPCNVQQECRKEQVSVAAILLAELEDLRQRHEKLAGKYGAETWGKSLAEKQQQAAQVLVQLMDLVKEEQA